MAKVKYKLIPLGAQVVAAAGTRQVLGTTRELENITISAPRSNTGDMYIGDDTVDSTNGVILEPGMSVSLTADTYEDDSGYAFLDLADLWVDAEVNGEEVRIFTFEEQSVEY